MDQFMENFLGYEGFGPPMARRDVPPEKIDKFRGKTIGDPKKYDEATLEMLEYFKCLEKNGLLK